MTTKQACSPQHKGFNVPLKSGENAVVRPISLADKVTLSTAFDQLSFETRANRYLTPIAKLPSSMLNYLADVDQVNHVAWGIGLPTVPQATGIGVGRFVRLPQEPDVAEFALTVVDAYQGRRIGTFLLALLYRLAQESGLRMLRGVVAPDNRRMLSWMEQLGAERRFTADELFEVDLAIQPELNLPATKQAGRFGRIFNLIRAGEAQHPHYAH